MLGGPLYHRRPERNGNPDLSQQSPVVGPLSRGEGPRTTPAATQEHTYPANPRWAAWADDFGLDYLRPG
jgi:hypothetical protein